jgi:hypothetical protein
MAETRSRHERQLPYIKRQQLIWLAGLIEGEGCFYTRKDKHGIPSFTLSMTDEDVIAYAADLLGCNYYTRQRREANAKTVYTIQINGYKVIDLIHVLLPYMFSRRRQKMLEVDEAWSTRGPAKNGNWQKLKVR